MAYEQRTGVASAAQSISTDGRGFLRLIVERAVHAVAGIFSNTKACLRPVAALCVEQSEEWLSG